MPGAQPRKDPLTRLVASVIRGVVFKGPGSAKVKR